MIQRRGDKTVSLMPRTLGGWIALVFVAAFYGLFILSWGSTSTVGPWIAIGCSIVGIVLGIIVAAVWRDVSVVLGVLGALTLSLTPFVVYALLKHA